MITTIIPQGEKYVLVLDKPLLDLMNITSETPLEVTTDGKTLTVAPSQNASRAQKFAEIRKEMIAEYAETFRKLAE